MPQTSVQPSRVSLETFPGADPSGMSFSDHAMNAALKAADHVVIPAGKQFKLGNKTAFKVTGDNKTIECVGTGKLLGGGGQVMLDVFGRNFTARNLNAAGALAATSAVQLRAAGAIDGGVFSGDWIYPLAFAASGCRAQGWKIDGTNAPHMNAAVLAQSCDGLMLSQFTIDNYQGFGIHYVNQDTAHAAATGWKISDGHIFGRRQSQTVIAKDGQSVFEFRTRRKSVRFGVHINDVPIASSAWTLDDIDGGNQKFRLKIDPRRAGDRVTLHANASLEAINIGSRVAEGLVSRVVSEEAGDSSFVVCDDDHRGSGWGITFRECQAIRPLYAGFAETSTDTHNNAYIDCAVQNPGIALNSGPDVIYSSGFMLSGSKGVVRGCRVTNDASRPSAQYGIFLNGSGESWNVSAPQFSGPYKQQLRR